MLYFILVCVYTTDLEGVEIVVGVTRNDDDEGMQEKAINKGQIK